MSPRVCLWNICPVRTMLPAVKPSVMPIGHRCGNKFLGPNEFEKMGQDFHGSCVQAIWPWVGFLGASVERLSQLALEGVR